MSTRRILTTLALALLVTGCTDQTPLAMEEAQYSETDGALSFSHTPHTGGLLTDIPVTGILTGGTFEGLLSITEFAYEGGQLLVSGTLTGTVTQGTTVTPITQTFADLPVDLTGRNSPCRILFLEIPGGVLLDLLGLVVDLAPVELEVRAERGPGNLLGNLLCAITGLLDGVGALGALLNLIERINDLL